MVGTPAEANPWAIAVANVVGVQRRDGADFALLNLSGGQLPSDVLQAVRRAAYSHEDSTVAYIPGWLAREVGAGLLAGPVVAEPGDRLAGEADYLSFARRVMPDRDEAEVGRRSMPAWNELFRAAGTIESAREWLALLPVLRDPPTEVRVGEKQRTPADLRRIAALPLRFVLPHDHEETGVTGRFVDLESLYSTLDTMLAEGYPKASQYFNRLGRISLDLLARFTNAQFPERPPLPTKG